MRFRYPAPASVPPERAPNRFRFAIREAIQIIALDSEDESIDKDDLKARLEALNVT
jgi:hypothetical protein